MPSAADRATDREIRRLALPALAALVAEPLFLLGDAAVVGHLGTAQLAALGLAGTVLQTVVGLCVFLAYGTTARVARLLGAGREREALADGLDGLWLAVAIGVPVTIATAVLGHPLLGLLGAGPAVTGAATTYLRLAALGTTPLLLLLAATGVLRGRRDTRTPLLVAVAGNTANLALNVLLVYPAGLGLAGSAIGSVVAQAGSAAALVAVVVRRARAEGASLRPRPAGIVRTAHAGVPLVVRTLTLRAALLLTTVAVTLGASGRALEVDLAVHQLATTLWGFLALVLDALAIAAQPLVAHHLGADDREGLRRTTRRLGRWALATGGLTTVGLALGAPVLGRLFTEDAAVRDGLVPVLLIAALAQTVAALVFLLDGVLIGADDAGYLARAGLGVAVVYAPVVLLAGHAAGLLGVWTAFTAVFIGGRALTLVPRARHLVGAHAA